MQRKLRILHVHLYSSLLISSPTRSLAHLLTHLLARSIKRALKRIPLILGLLKRDPQLKQLDNRISEIVEENLIILCIDFHVLSKRLIFDKLHIRGQHHQRLGLDIFKLLGPIPLLVLPLLLNQELEEVIRHRRGTECPRPVVPRAIAVAAAEGVGAG